MLSNFLVAPLLIFASATNAMADPIIGPDDPGCLHETSPWQITCASNDVPCVAVSGPLVLFVDDEGQPRMLFRQFKPERVSVLNGRMVWDLPAVFHAPLTADEIRLLSQDGAFAILEKGEEPPLLVPSENLAIALAQIASLSSSTPCTPPANLSASPMLQKYEEIQKQYEQPHPYFLPAIKPQVQFSLRAQTGWSLPVISGAGDSVEQAKK